jgi:endogenous inhibitor of DNA gyrase (YacG/DUF329 family)
MDAQDALPATRCPGCGTPMRALALERHFVGAATIDLCGECRALWFDALESAELSPGATLALFEAIAKAGTGPGRPFRSPLPCPRCGHALAPTQDLQRTTRFTYFRCPRGHGRFTPFFQFLREKNFVRPLAPAELARLRSAIRSVRCSSCGAPVDLEEDSVCRYCSTPLAILDPDAVSATASALASAEAKRTTIDADALVDAMIAARGKPDAERPGIRATAALDLVGLGLAAIALVLRG